MDFGLLGPLEVSDLDGPVRLGGSKRRALLALLLLHANDVVSEQRLIAAAWGDRPPASAARSLRTQLSRLGEELNGRAGRELLGRRANGYVMTVDAGDVDLHRFERALDQGRRALAARDLETADERLRDAASLWRGEALADFADGPVARAELARLEALRIALRDLETELVSSRAARAEPVLVASRSAATQALDGPGAYVPGADPTIAGYRIDATVGRGGMGVVYRATDLSLDRCVALKLIAPELAADRRFRERFLRESRVAASLEHPHVLPIYEARQAGDAVYMAMRYVDGKDLGTVLRGEHRLAPDEALGICGQIAGALDAAAAKGLVHRDVKPANVLLDDAGHAYLVDFGLAKRATAATTLTDAGTLMGTLDYVAPEQIRGEQLDGRTDQYALACCLVECLTGSPPFRRATEAETLWAHMQQAPPRLSEFPALDSVLRRGLAKDRDERYDSCADLIAAAGTALTPRPRRRARLLELVAGRRAPSRRAAVLILAASGLLGGAALAAISQRAEPPPAQPAAALDIAANAIAGVDPRSGRVQRSLPLPGRPTDLAAGDGTLWATTVNSRALTGVRIRTGAIERQVPLPIEPAAVAVDKGTVWVADGEAGQLVAVVEGYEDASAPIRFRRGRRPSAPARGRDATSVTVGGGSVWITDGSRRLVRVDPSTREVSATPTRGALVDATFAHGAVWAISARPPAVLRVDAGTGAVTDDLQIARAGDQAPLPVGIAASESALWVLNANTATVTRIDPTGGVTDTVTIGVDRIPNAIAAGGRTAWVANEDGSLSRIDEGAREATSIHVGESLRQVAVAGATVWIGTVAIDQSLPGGAG